MTREDSQEKENNRQIREGNKKSGERGERAQESRVQKET